RGTRVACARRGGAISARACVPALERAEAYWQQVQSFLARFALLLMPTVAVPPFPVDERPPRVVADQPVSPLGWMPFTFPFNLTGQPAASVPAGWTDDGVPVGLQVGGQRHADRTGLAACAPFEAARPRADPRPPL